MTRTNASCTLIAVIKQISFSSRENAIFTQSLGWNRFEVTPVFVVVFQNCDFTRFCHVCEIKSRLVTVRTDCLAILLSLVLFVRYEFATTMSFVERFNSFAQKLEFDNSCQENQLCARGLYTTKTTTKDFTNLSLQMLQSD